MKFGYEGYWAEFRPEDSEAFLRNILPETPAEMRSRLAKTNWLTPPLPLPRGLGRTLEGFNW